MKNIKCDICGKDAKYDAKTIYGPWAFVCDNCFEKHTNKIIYTKLKNVHQGD